MKSTHRSLNISIVGAGRVGTTLACMLFRARQKIVAVVSRNKLSAKTCSKIVSCKNCSEDFSIIPASSDLIIIAVPDPSIRTVAESIASVPNLPFNRMFVCHTSGALTSDELGPLALKGARVFSLHPIQTFPKQKSLTDQIESMKGITFGFEGPTNARTMARTLIRQLGGNILVVPKEAKILYHLACVIASNYSVTLVGALEPLVARFTQKKLAPFAKLLRTSLDNALEFGAADALTGPIVRGDGDTISRHLAAIQDPHLRTLYESLGAYALKMASDAGRLAPDQVSKLQELLNDGGKK